MYTVVQVVHNTKKGPRNDCERPDINHTGISASSHSKARFIISAPDLSVSTPRPATKAKIRQHKLL